MSTPTPENNCRELVRAALHSSLARYRELTKSSAALQIARSTEQDITLRLDLELQAAIINSVKDSGLAARIVSEELNAPRDLVENPHYYITIDPLDGTENAQRGKAPHASIIGIYDSLQPTFNDIVAAGGVELTSGDLWFADATGCYKNDQIVKTSAITNLTKKTQCIVDGYYPENVERCKQLYQKARVRDHGSSATHFAWLASGQVDAFVSLYQKNHELGAGWLLVTKAGSVVTDALGNELGPRPYVFEEKVPMIAAATEELQREILSLIQCF